MKFKTRLKVIFATGLFLPLVLTTIAFIVIGAYLTSMQHGYTVEEINYSIMSESLQSHAANAEASYQILMDQMEQDISKFEDISFLEEINAKIRKKSSYLLVRKESELYYAGNKESVDTIFEMLPKYGTGYLAEESCYYFNGLDRYVKQIDFLFKDGSQGSIFVITKMSMLIAKQLLIDMFVAIIVILLFTSIMLTRGLKKGVFLPVDQMNIAMRRIKEGDYDYVLPTDMPGEIGDLYRNYEDMRLRLKESIDENCENDKQNRELISNISHDLKTPITAIKGYVEGIMDGVADTPEKIDKYVRTIYNKAIDMDRLINELTIYSGIDNNRIPYNFHRINVSEYFGDCVEEVGLDLESKNIELNYSNFADPETIVIADPEQMKRVINNIISNSAKYMDKQKGTIDIRILDDSDAIRIEIEDNGKGIAQKDLPKIFERFYRTDASRNSAQGGSGIGLSIVKKIVEDHGGYIWATSKECEGTCIHFVIRKYKELQNS